MTLDTGTLTLLGTLIGGAFGGAAGFWLNARLKLNADKRIDKQYSDQQINKGYEFVIAQLTTQNEKLEKERKEQINQLSATLDDVRDRERECIKVQEGLRVQNLEHQKDIERLTEEVEKLKSKFEKV